MLKPLHDYVILKKEKAETQTASGIILTSPKEQASNQATVVAVSYTHLDVYKRQMITLPLRWLPKMICGFMSKTCLEAMLLCIVRI